MKPDFFTLLEHQLVEAAERDVAASPQRRALKGAGRGALAWLPVAAALACVALIAGVALTVGGEENTDTRDSPVAAAPPVRTITGTTSPRGVQTATLTGPRGARGTVTITETASGRGLSFTARPLPRSNRYYAWAEDRDGKPVGLGYATYDPKKREVAGALEELPPALRDLRRFFITREASRPKRPDERVALDSGRLPG